MPDQCAHCGAAIHESRRRYCRDACRWQAKEDRRKDSGYYDRKWKREAARRQDAGSIPRFSYPNECDWPDCIERTERAKYCRTHGAALRKRRARESLDTSPSATDARRRARYFGVEYEPVRRLDVFNRDAWQCQLCHAPVDPDLRWPHPESPSLDHIIPMSRGGGHTMPNTQLTHLRCNIAKGNRGAAEAKYQTEVQKQ